MANIEKRRKKRIVIPIVIISCAVLLTAGIIIALVLLISHNKHKAQTPDPSEPLDTIASESNEPTDGPTPLPTDTVPSPAATQQPTEDAVKTQPADTENISGGDPVRITEDLSAADIELRVKDGRVALRCLISFVNNTDSVLYYAGFYTGGLQPVIATSSGQSAKFYVDENGMLVIPFINELETGGSCDIYFELEGVFDPDNGITLPVFGYDTAYLLYASIDSDVSLNSEGASLKFVSVDSMYHYSIVKQTVRSVILK